MIPKGATLANTIATLQDVRERSVIDEISGCWLFRSGQSRSAPRIYFVHPETGVKAVKTGSRAAWILAGNGDPPKGMRIYRHECANEGCVNPDHLRIGLAVQQGASIRKHGKHRGRPDRIAVNTRNSAKRIKLTPEQVERIKTSSETATALAAQFGVSANAVGQVRLGRTHRGGCIHGASVFTWRPSA